MCAADGRSGCFVSDDDDSSVGALSGGRSDRGPCFGGGQTSLYQRVPKRSFNSRHGPPKHQQQDRHKELVDPGLATCSRIKHGIELLGNDSQHLTAKLDTEVSQVSESSEMLP
ncbi:hypothetical protein PC117_g14307 [Phytophthora cactorum]|uniref:Uncharacterized protein n=1 Tax=Phytophthora cactorum TaxID=29920 RepID=A0A8T1CRM7_9STRA|nr:hypothetical protein PC117_g14307 [Phytophthora cactorum]